MEDRIAILIATNFQRLRTKAGYPSVSKIKDETGVAITTLININRGRSKAISFSVLGKLSDYFGVEPSEFFKTNIGE